MKKWNIYFAAIVMMLMGLDLYAADGDLLVNGNLGVGGISSTDKFSVSGSAYITGDTFFYSKYGSQRGSIHYGPFGKIGQTTNFAPNYANSGLWIEGSNDWESAGIFLNGNTIVLWSPGDNDILRVYDEDGMPSAYPLFVIDWAGNVGIRMAQPAGWGFSYALNVGGSAYATGYWQTSDKEFKENITPIDSPLSKILNMEGISFTWKQEKDEERVAPDVKPEGDEEKKLSDEQKRTKKNKRFPEGKHYGVIAQDIEKVMPEVVMEGTGGDKAVNYSELIPVLIEAIKEQQKIIEKQQTDIKALMMAIDEIKGKTK